MSQLNAIAEQGELDIETTEDTYEDSVAEWASDSERLAQESAPVDETPAEAELSPAPSQELTDAHAEIVRLTQERNAAQQKEVNESIENHSRTLADAHVQSLLATGSYTDEAARELAESRRETYVAKEQLAAMQNQSLGAVDKALSEKYGVAEVLLKVFTTEEQKEAYAKAASAQEKRNSTEKQATRAANAPAQQYSRQAGRGTAGKVDWKQAQRINKIDDLTDADYFRLVG